VTLVNMDLPKIYLRQNPLDINQIQICWDEGDWVEESSVNRLYPHLAPVLETYLHQQATTQLLVAVETSIRDVLAKLTEQQILFCNTSHQWDVVTIH